jgi:cell division protein FtsW
MPVLSRADNSTLGRWWWTVDRWTLTAICVLIGFGYIMMLAASPAVADRIHVSRDLFILKQVVFLAVAGAIVVGVSLCSPRDIRRIALVGCVAALTLTAMTLVMGIEIKGARRWIALPGLQVQPSEFLKPCFAVAAAWLISEGKRLSRFPGSTVAILVFLAIAFCLKSQPDIGMLAVVTVVFFAQLFLAGLNLFVVGLGVLGLGGAAFAAYELFGHVHKRVQEFLHPGAAGAAADYQPMKALEAFGNGGLWGRGPGEGHVKDVLPDAHADFVFAVAGEEFGMVICLVIICVFAFIVLRCLLQMLKEPDPFIVLSSAGLAIGFGLQAFVNMASSLQLIPTKGMTLPFISYGGSSAMAVALGMGMLLSLTRRRHHGDDP